MGTPRAGSTVRCLTPQVPTLLGLAVTITLLRSTHAVHLARVRVRVRVRVGVRVRARARIRVGVRVRVMVRG